MADVRTSLSGYNARNFRMISVSSVSVRDFYSFSSLLSMWLPGVMLPGVVLRHFNNKCNLENSYCTLLLFCENLKLTCRTVQYVVMFTDADLSGNIVPC
jgi:hypothetical protein